MKIFIWERVRKCSNNYHQEGGVVVFAETEDDARAMANAVEGCAIGQEENPDRVSDATGDPQVFIFPDAGCC